MSLEIWLAVLPAIIIFIYGTENFSKEIQKAAGTQFQSILKKATKNPIAATIFGAGVTAAIQSSTATTLITIGLVNAGTITFAQSLGIIFGANLGTTLTAQLVAWKLTEIGPILVIGGFVLSFLKTKYKIFGKPLFYFGLILYALNLISFAVLPLKSDPQIMELIAQTSFIPLGILVGFIVTNIFFSSSVTTGLVVVLAQNGLLGLPQAIPIILGANMGTTTTGLITSLRMDTYAKRAALAHFLFNLAGVLLCLPLIAYLIISVEMIGGTTAQMVANAHLIFNLLATLVLLLFIKQFQFMVEKIIPTDEKEIVLSANLLEGAEKKTVPEAFDAIIGETRNAFDAVIKIFIENKTILLSNKKTEGKVAKLTALTEYIHHETSRILTEISKKELTHEEGITVVKLARVSKLSEQLARIGQDLEKTIIYTKENDVDFSEEGKMGLDECMSKIIDNLIIIKDNFPKYDKKISRKMKTNGDELREMITKNYKGYFDRLMKGHSTSGSAFANALGLLQDSEDKAREVRKITGLEL
jgi:phosphate:Na+ symporter